MHSHDYVLSAATAKADRPVLVLGHSLGTNFSLWEPTLQQLGENFRLLRYNPHPQPNGVDNVSIEARGRQLLQLLDRLGFNRVDFVGVSISGLLGQWLALNAADRIRGLVLSNTAARIGTPKTWEDRIKLIQAKGLANVAEDLVNRWFSSEFLVQQPEVVRSFINDLRAFSTEEYLAGCAALRDADFGACVRQIKTRTLIIGGTHDRAATLSDAEFLNEQIVCSRLLVLPCGHLACTESASAFANAVTEFLLESS